MRLPLRMKLWTIGISYGTLLASWITFMWHNEVVGKPLDISLNNAILESSIAGENLERTIKGKR